MKQLVVISAVWCPSCLILKKHLKRLEQDYSMIDILRLDYDMDEEEIKKYNVGDKLPVIILFKDGKEVNRIIGEKTYDEIISVLKESEVI